MNENKIIIKKIICYCFCKPSVVSGWHEYVCRNIWHIWFAVVFSPLLYFSVNLCFCKYWFRGTVIISVWVCFKYSYHMWLDMRAITPFEYCGLDLFRFFFSTGFHSGVPMGLYSFVWFPHDVIVRVMILCWYKIIN